MQTIRRIQVGDRVRFVGNDPENRWQNMEVTRITHFGHWPYQAFDSNGVECLFHVKELEFIEMGGSIVGDGILAKGD